MAPRLQLSPSNHPNPLCVEQQEQANTDEQIYNSTIDVHKYNRSNSTSTCSGGGGGGSASSPDAFTLISILASADEITRSVVDMNGTRTSQQQERRRNGQQQTKSVRFAVEDEVFQIRHIDDFSEEEIANIWFDQQYYADIKNEYKEVIFALECGKHIESDEETSRGLEHRTQEGSMARFQIKRDSYNDVLDEQDRQWKEDADDDELISKIYREHSVVCAKKAYQMGLADELAARQVYTESLMSLPQSIPNP